MSDLDGKTLLAVKVTPGAKRNSINAYREGVFYIKIAASPVEGRANEKLIAYLEQTLGIRKNAIAVVKGKTSRNKLIAVAGLDGEDVKHRLVLEMRR